MSSYPTRTVAILSDIHGNLAALRAVMTDIAAQRIVEIVVAGDLVGFGAQSNEVVDLLAERGVALVRGNHEHDYVAPYDADNQQRELWRADPRLAAMCWYLDRLGSKRRVFLATLPLQHWLDPETLVVHGSTRHIRDAVLKQTPVAELDEMFGSTSARLVFVGHTHRPVIRATSRRRIVNVGSVGAPLGGDPLATYAVARRSTEAPGDWIVELRQVRYSVEDAVAAFGNGIGAADPGFAEIMARQLRTGKPYLAGWLRLRAQVPDAELAAALTRYLEENP